MPLRFARAFLVSFAAEPSWRDAVAAWLSRRGGPVALDDLYRAFVGHPKAHANRHWRAKLRQTLQRGEGTAFRRAGRGRWEAAGAAA
jgi:hypothetical protein